MKEKQTWIYYRYAEAHPAPFSIKGISYIFSFEIFYYESIHLPGKFVKLHLSIQSTMQYRKGWNKRIGLLHMLYSCIYKKTIVVILRRKSFCSRENLMLLLLKKNSFSYNDLCFVFKKTFSNPISDFRKC